MHHFASDHRGSRRNDRRIAAGVALAALLLFSACTLLGGAPRYIISRRGLGDLLGVATLGTLLVDALCEDLQFNAPEDGAGLLDYFRIRRRPRG